MTRFLAIALFAFCLTGCLRKAVQQSPEFLGRAAALGAYIAITQDVPSPTPPPKPTSHEQVPD
jgi:hypothetical protein